MYSTAWANQFEIKDTCIEFVVNNVSPQCNDFAVSDYPEAFSVIIN